MAELDRLIGNRDYLQFLNTRNDIYRQRDLARKPPSRQEALSLMSEYPNLIKRPILVKGAQIVLGYDEAALGKML